MTSSGDTGRLTDRQRRFIRAFLAHGDGYLCATRAARLAGYAWPGKQGPRLLSFPWVAGEVESGFRDLLEAVQGACRRT